MQNPTGSAYLSIRASILNPYTVPRTIKAYEDPVFKTVLQLKLQLYHPV